MDNIRQQIVLMCSSCVSASELISVDISNVPFWNDQLDLSDWTGESIFKQGKRKSKCKKPHFSKAPSLYLLCAFTGLCSNNEGEILFT